MGGRGVHRLGSLWRRWRQRPTAGDGQRASTGCHADTGPSAHAQPIALTGANTHAWPITFAIPRSSSGANHGTTRLHIGLVR